MTTKNPVEENDQPHELIQGMSSRGPLIHRLVLTGGPCGGKTTAKARLAAFFEELGWKVFRVPETASILMSGGVAFQELDKSQILDFQEHLLRTMIEMEDTFFSLAKIQGQKCLVICDRGAMDPAAFVDREEWMDIVQRCGRNEQQLCEHRYDHVVHMVSAACGAEAFYTLADNSARHEGLELARERDTLAMEAWRMHPYVDVVDNRANFEQKIKHLLGLVTRRLGMNDLGDTLKADSRKLKFVLRTRPDEDLPVNCVDFDVVHHYLKTGRKGVQSRLRRRSHLNRYTYTLTERRPERMGQRVEVKTNLSRRDYEHLLTYCDSRHLPVYKTRRCFVYQHQQYQLDIYREPCHSRCKDLVMLETFTTLSISELLPRLPPFLDVGQEVSGDPAFSMYNLALRSEWSPAHFCINVCPESEQGDEKQVHAAIKRFNSRHDIVNDNNNVDNVDNNNYVDNVDNVDKERNVDKGDKEKMGNHSDYSSGNEADDSSL